MKLKSNFIKVGIGRKTYFHHQNGVVVSKGKTRITLFGAVATLVLAGGFFVGIEYGLPLLKKSSDLQNSKQVSADSLVPEADQASEVAEQPILQEDELLKSAVQQQIDSYPSDQQWSVYIYDLNGDKSVSINADTEYDSASLYKLFLLESLESKLSFDKWDWTYVKNMPISECVTKMLQTTDDACSEELASYIGWDYIDEQNAKNGYTMTKVAGNEGRKTTAGDVGKLLTKLKKGHTMSDFARRFVFDVLYQQNYKKGIPKACNDCRAADKLGELSDNSHDAAVVTHGGKSYVLVVMSKGGSYKQVEEITKLVDSKYYTPPAKD